MGLSERRKGASGELEVVHLLQEHGYENARRTHDGREQMRRGDIANGPFAHWEIKRTEKAQVWAWWDQAVRDADDSGKPPIVAFRRSRSPWLALIELDDLIPLLRLREVS